MKDASQHSAVSTGDNDKKKKKKEPMASTGETLSFVFSGDSKMVVIWFVGMLGALGNGAVRMIS